MTSSETPQASIPSSENPQAAMTSLQAFQTAMTSSDTPQIAMTSLALSQNNLTSLEMPLIAVTSLKPPQIVVTSSETPQMTVTSSETPQMAVTSSETLQMSVPSLELPQDNMTSSKAPQIVATSSAPPQVAVTSSEAPQIAVTSLALPQNTMTSSENPQTSVTSFEEEKSAVAWATRRSTRKTKRTNDVINDDSEINIKPKQRRVVTSKKMKKATLPNKKKSSATSRRKKATAVTSPKKTESNDVTSPKKNDVIISDVVKSCVMTVPEGQEPDINDVISKFTEQLRANNVTVTSQPPPITTNLTTISPDGVFTASLATGLPSNDPSLNTWLNSSHDVINQVPPASGRSGGIMTSPSRSIMTSSRDSFSSFNCRNDNDDDSSMTPKRRSLRSMLMTSQHQRRVNLISVPISPSKLGGTPLRTPSPTADVIKRDATPKRKSGKKLEMSDDVITSNTSDVIKRKPTKKRKNKKPLEEYLKKIDVKEFVTKLHEKNM